MAALRQLPIEAQNAIAKMLRTLVDETSEEDGIPVGHLPAIEEGLAQFERGEFKKVRPLTS